MNQRKVHLNTSTSKTLCGQPTKRWPSATITTVKNPTSPKITCAACLRKIKT